ncbi:divergent polysaccharide deacetylase family protein [Aureimonas populi]|uniref:Divergent polysaccharide deacetylase family protein n=1 Tax=Aureimonas populi TaxID=1701758 RepID=A0ABW5CRL9_9HYPH|nr:divergent polysaccharide deacetylase family protein [Aureimonas populi]
MTHDLHRPLGQHSGRARPRAVSAGLSRLAIGVAGLCLLAASTAVALRDNRFPEPAAAPSAALPQPDAPPAGSSAPRGPTITRMNGDAGVSVVEVSPFAVDEAYTGSIRVFEPGSLRQPARMAHLPDQALLEFSAYGMLPRRSADGRRPLDVYAGASAAGRGTRVALVVGGLGISQTGTQAALRLLPQGVTLAFAASGNSLDRWMQEARRNGHELLLQAPMEPFGYPNVSPGPGTLTAADAAAGDFENLHKALARMTNYVGVMNFMGARLTAEAPAMENLLGELGRRGLLYVDDGSSARSIARDVAMASRVPFATAEQTLDATRDPQAIRAELDRLERSARAQGTAIGFASAFDVSVETIAAWAGEAQARGIEIVPVSALAHDPETR